MPIDYVQTQYGVKPYSRSHTCQHVLLMSSLGFPIKCSKEVNYTMAINMYGNKYRLYDELCPLHRELKYAESLLDGIDESLPEGASLPSLKRLENP